MCLKRQAQIGTCSVVLKRRDSYSQISEYLFMKVEHCKINMEVLEPVCQFFVSVL